MKILRSSRSGAILLAIALMLFPQIGEAAPPATSQQQRRVAGVAMYSGGVFVGHVVNRRGSPKINAKVVITQNAEIVAVAHTNKEGQFVFRGIRAGVYQVQVDRSVFVYRLWAPRTAPPAARPTAFLVIDSNVVLGQDDGRDHHHKKIIAGALGAGALIWALDHNSPGS